MGATTEFRTAPCCSARVQAMAELEQVYTRYVERIYRFVYSRVGNRQDAEDLTAETFLKAARQLDVSRSDTSIATWLFTVARTVLADHWRTSYRSRTGLLIEEFSEQPDTNTEPLAAQQQASERRVAEILQSLTPRHRRVLELRFLHGFSVRQTAQELGLTPGNVRVLQHRALAQAAQLESAVPPATAVSGAPELNRAPGRPDPRGRSTL